MQDTDEISQSLTTDSIGSLLLRYSIPGIISMTAMSVYNVIDSIYIGHGVGPLALSAMGVIFPFMNLVFAFSLLIGIGGASYTSINIGKNDIDAAFKVLGNVFLLNLISSAFISGVLLYFLDPLLITFGASSQTKEYASDFMKIILIGTPTAYTMFNLNHVMRASGYPVKAMSSVLLSVFLNVILGALFILVFKWGMKGAALATILSQIGALMWVLTHFFNKKSVLHFKKGIFSLDITTIKRILSIGLSPCMLFVLTCAVAIFINKALMSFQGDLGIGAFGVMNRVIFLFTMIVAGIAQGMQPIVGFNYGAGKLNRVYKALNYGIISGFIVTTIGFLLAHLCPEFIASLFSDNEELNTIVVNGLRIGLIAFPFIGAQIVIYQFFQSVGKPKIAIVLSVSRQLVFLLPFLYLLPQWYGYNGVWASIPISDFFSFLLAVILLYFYKKNQKA